MTHKPKIPRLVSGVDVRALPLTPLEGFVLSRVDGVASVGDIADLTNLGVDECAAVVLHLIELAAVEWADGSVSLPRASMRPSAPRAERSPNDPPSRPSVLPRLIEEQKLTPVPGADRRSEPPPARPGARQGILERHQGLPYQPTEHPPKATSPIAPPASGAAAPVAAAPAAPAPAAPAPAAPADEIELSPERRKRIDDLWIALDLLNHYELLGVSRRASRQEIRAAYFELSKAFHPDTAFRKKVGTYRTKMEAIFKRLTEAYEVLGKNKPREDYDSYLSSIGESKDAEEALSGEHELPEGLLEATAPGPVAPPASSSSATTSSAPTAAGVTAPGITAVGATAPGTVTAASTVTATGSVAAPHGLPPAGKSTSGTMPAVRDSSPPPTATPRPISEESRRRAAELFQRRLDGAQGRARSSTPPSMPATPRTREDMARELKQVIQSSASISGGAQPGVGGAAIVNQQLADARRAEAQGELAMAVRALRIALATAPDRADVASEHERVAKLLAVSLADRYTDQATYEERNKKWAAAALTWSKVLDGRPDDLTALLGAAQCLVEAQGDMRKAQRFAQRAVDLSPQNGAALRMLGRVCLAAGLPLNARRALQQALALDPADAQAKSLLAMVMTQGG